MSTFVHPQGLCESKTVGDNTRIWAFAHVLPRVAYLTPPLRRTMLIAASTRGA